MSCNLSRVDGRGHCSPMVVLEGVRNLLTLKVPVELADCGKALVPANLYLVA